MRFSVLSIGNTATALSKLQEKSFEKSSKLSAIASCMPLRAAYVGGGKGGLYNELVAEHLLVALVAAGAGLAIGWLAAPLLSSAGAGLLGVPGAPALTPGTVGLVIAVAVGVTLGATLVPAFRAAHTSTVSALENAARSPRRHTMLIAISRRLPTSLLIGVRLIARRPRRAMLATASTTITVTGIVAVLAAHYADDVPAGRFDWFAGLSDPVSGRVSQVMALLTVVLVALAAVNAAVTGWATALDARQSLAVARVLGGTPQQVSAGLSAAQVLPALPGGLLGIPLGIGLFAVANGAGEVSVPPGSWLVAVVLGTLAAVTALTAVPAILGARQPAVLILRAEGPDFDPHQIPTDLTRTGHSRPTTVSARAPLVLATGVVSQSRHQQLATRMSTGWRPDRRRPTAPATPLRN